MVRYRNRLLAAASVIVTAGTVAISGLAAASASPAAGPSVSGTEHFQIMTTSATSSKSSIIFHGAVFTAGGVSVGGNGNNGTGTAVFPGGTVKIRHHTVHSKQTFNSKTCLFTLHARGTYRITGGTGKYAGIRGHGKFVVSILLVAARNSNGRCSQRKAPLAFQQVINAQGPAHL
jgi:hypothetical protein